MQHFLLASAYALSLALAHPARPAHQCITFDVPMSFNATSLQPSFPPFANHYESVSFLEKLTSRTSTQGPSPISGVKNITVDVTIAAEYCSPRRNPKTTLQILTHGLGFDRSYWSFGGRESQYNYAKAATEAGYPVLFYDRIGNGQSTKSDPYTINQMQIEVQVLKILTDYIRNNDIPALKHVAVPEKIVHVGHSFGSLISDALVAYFPTVSDGIILTGFSATPGPNEIISSNFHLASENQPTRFGNLSSGYLTWGDELANQYAFLHWPDFAPEVLAQAEASKWPMSVGEVLTLKSTPAPEFKGPALVLTGEYDVIFCSDNCTGILDQAASLFPQAQPFQSYAQPNTGHGINLHYNATGAYGVITDFINQNV